MRCSDYALFAQLVQIVAGSFSPPSETPTSYKTLGRLKMLWNYLRSSLPETFFDPMILRQKSTQEMVGMIEEKWIAAFGSLKERASLTHRPELDWVYSGGSKAGNSTTNSPEPVAASIGR